MDAIGGLYDLHHESIYRYLRSRVSDAQAAEDLTGEVFMRMLSALPRYQSRGLPFRAWLFRIARNLLVDHYRKQSGPVSVPLDEAEARSKAEADPERLLEEKLSLESLQAALSKIDGPQREVVVLRFLAGLSIRETAKTLGKTEAAVKALQHRGLAALRAAPDQW